MAITVELLVDQCIQTILSVIPVTPFALSKKLSIKWKVFLLTFAVIVSNLMDADHLRIIQNGIKGICIVLGGRTAMHSLIGVATATFAIFAVTAWQYYVFNFAAREKWITAYHVIVVTWVGFSSLFMHLVWDARGKYGAMLLFPIESRYFLPDSMWAIVSILMLTISLIWVGVEYAYSNQR